MEPFWRSLADGLSVAVRVQPGARKPGVGGITESAGGPRLRIAVTEAAENGRANRAVCSALAEAIGVAPSRIEVTAGAASRLKRLRVEGDPAMLCERLAGL